jgi:cyanophycinase
LNPKGKLLIIGGSEDKGPIRRPPVIKLKNKGFVDFEILRTLIPGPDSKFKTIEVITTASQVPFQTGNMYIRSFKKAGFTNVGHISIENKEELINDSYLERISRAHAILFSGGDQYRLSTIIAGSDLMAAIAKRYREDEEFILAGTSAGAMAMSYVMIYHAEVNEAMLKGHVKTTHGLEMIDHCIIDTHFVKRGRFVRLSQAVIMNPTCMGIGLGEDTALLIENGNEAMCLGSGMVVIIDGSEMDQCNLNEVENDYALCVQNLKVHLLVRGCGFLISERKFIPISRKEEREIPEEIRNQS